jgi:uncharacterized membrane protein
MGDGHAHGAAAASPPRTRRILAAIIVPLALATVAGMVLLWPREQPATVGGEQPVRRNGTVTAVQPQPCTQPQSAGRQCGTVTVRLEDGPTVTARIPEGPGSPAVAADDRIVVVESAGEYAVLDHQRGRGLLALVALFAAVIVAFGRWRGVAALGGLGVSFAILFLFVLPAIATGGPPLAVAIVGAAAIMLAVLYLTHGVSVRTSVAVLGTLVSLVLTGLLGAYATTALHMTGFGSEESSLVSVFLGDIDPRGLLLAGIVIGTLGVLDDVTVTQAETVAALATANPALGRGGFYRAAARVGRAHIASTVNTIVLAYAGASLPLLLLVIVSGQPASTVLTSEFIANEIVRSAVGTIGLVAAVPVTTALAAFVTTRAPTSDSPGSGPAGKHRG